MKERKANILGRSPGQQRKKMETENAIRRKPALKPKPRNKMVTEDAIRRNPALKPKPRKKTQKYSGQGEELVR